MEAIIKKWGNSFAIRIPKTILTDARVEAGNSFEIKVEDGNIVLKPKKKEHSLDMLLKNITDENIHSEVLTGNQLGGEIW